MDCFDISNSNNKHSSATEIEGFSDNDAFSCEDEDKHKFYKDAEAYWNKIPPTVNGMLGGFAHISSTDILGSEEFLKGIFKLKPPPGHARAADCGAGIGRITFNLLQRYFDTTDLIEVCDTFLQKAKRKFKNSTKIGNYICEGLQEFRPKPNTYDVVWCQWVLGHLTDEDLVTFFGRISNSLKPDGVIIIKENITSSGDVEKDSTDSSVTRPESLLIELIKTANLKIMMNLSQKNFPEKLYAVKMLCVKPV